MTRGRPNESTAPREESQACRLWNASMSLLPSQPLTRLSGVPTLERSWLRRLTRRRMRPWTFSSCQLPKKGIGRRLNEVGSRFEDIKATTNVRVHIPWEIVFDAEVAALHRAAEAMQHAEAKHREFDACAKKAYNSATYNAPPAPSMVTTPTHPPATPTPDKTHAELPKTTLLPASITAPSTAPNNNLKTSTGSTPTRRPTPTSNSGRPTGPRPNWLRRTPAPETRMPQNPSPKRGKVMIRWERRTKKITSQR